MIENFSYIRTGSLLARTEPPSDLIPIPIPVFRPSVSFEDREPAPVECAILQELAEIKREVRALRAQSATQNVSAVPLERAEAMLGCKRAQVFKLLALGRLERAPKVGRSAMITVASIEALVAVGAQQTGGTRSRRAGQRPESINSKTRTDKCKTNVCMSQRDAVSFRQACVMLGALLGRLGHGAERQVWRGTACEARRALAAASGGLRPRSREWDRRGGDAQVAVPSFSSAWR